MNSRAGAIKRCLALHPIIATRKTFGYNDIPKSQNAE
jgi:hypothetical protein